MLTVTPLETQVFYSLFSVWLRRSTGTWFLHVKTGNKTIYSIQKYSDHLQSKTRSRTSSPFGQLFLNRLFTSSTSDNSGTSPFPTWQHTTNFSFHCTVELGSWLPSRTFFPLLPQDQRSCNHCCLQQPSLLPLFHIVPYAPPGMALPQLTAILTQTPAKKPF